MLLPIISLTFLSIFLLLLSYFPYPPSAQNNYLKLHLIHIKHPNSTSPSAALLLDSHRVSTLHRRIKFPLLSGAALGSGQYFAGISIGTPPRNHLLVVDTGSDLTWVKCSACRRHCADHHPLSSGFLARHSSSFFLSHFFDHACNFVPYPTHQKCDRVTRTRTHTPCRYEYSYSDGSTTSSLFASEMTSLNTSSGQKVHFQELRFGCGFRISTPTGPSASGFEGASGVMGLGRGPISFTGQLGWRFGNRFSYCLGDYTHSPPPTSYLMIGGRLSSSKKANHHQLH